MLPCCYRKVRSLVVCLEQTLVRLLELESRELVAALFEAADDLPHKPSAQQQQHREKMSRQPQTAHGGKTHMSGHQLRYYHYFAIYTLRLQRRVCGSWPEYCCSAFMTTLRWNYVCASSHARDTQ